MSRKKKAKGLSFRQLLFLLWLVPLVGILLLVRQYNLAQRQQTSPGWGAIESVRVPAATGASVPVKNPSVTPPIVVEKPVVSGEPAAAAIPGAVADSGAIITEKLSLYENADWGYGFYMPYGVYWQGFGARDGAKHSVGISRSGAPKSFDSSDVKVWYFPNKDVPVEGHAGLFQDAQTGKTYFAVANGLTTGAGTDLFVIQAPSFDDKILGKIVETVFLK